jgi:FkbM family methyltransferase
MQVYSRIKQYYRYLRNWRKLQNRQAGISRDEQFAKQLDFYSELIKRNDLCFDIGANIGDKTSLFLQLGAGVVAVEPQESCWRVLKRRFKNDNVFIESVALAGEKGSKTLFVDRAHTLATISQDWITAVRQSGRFSSHNWASRISVPANTLDALIEKYGEPVFCKIDVEGSEFEVLQGLSRPIRAVSLEFVTERIDASLRCIDYLSKLGVAKFNYCIGETFSFSLPEWVDSSRMKEILQRMEKKIENYGEFYVRFAEKSK